MNNYVVTHLHSDLSNATTNIDSVTKFQMYIDKAKELGMKAIAFTEHGNCFNWQKKKEYCETCKYAVKNKIKGCSQCDKYVKCGGKYKIKYIHGIEAYVTEIIQEKVRDNYHCCLYARNWDGVKELNKLVSMTKIKKDSGYFYYEPRILFDELIHTSNNIIISTACLGGILNKGNEKIKNRFIDFLKTNKERCFLEIQHHNVEAQILYNRYLYKISQDTGVPLICGTDTHSLNQDFAEGRVVLQKSKNIYFGNEDGWDLTFKSYDELIKAYMNQNSLPINVVQEAINNTNKLADMIEEFKLDTKNKYPRLWKDSEKLFKEKIDEGCKIRGIYNKPKDEKGKYLNRIKDELKVYKQTDSIDYMLFMKDVIDYAHKNNMWQGYGRGSVNGSLIAYLLQITDMDSLKFNLNFFRFMNPSRVNLCDIDTDWSNKDRDSIKEFLFNYKGIYASEIITFNTIALKGAIRDVGRALDMDLSTIGIICDNIDTKEADYRKKYPKLFKYVDLVNGTIVSVGTHPSGVLISPLPIDEYIGTCMIATTDHPVSMLNMKELDHLNYVKFDILGLDNVDIINRTCELANIKRIIPENLDLNDEKVWHSIRDNTVSIFQWESNSAQSYIKELFSETTLQKIRKENPNINYLDLFSFGNGAIRPSGSSYRDLASVGIFKNNGLKELNEFLSSTMGYLTYQEQIMMFLVDFCGYSMAESDSVRRAIAKKLGTEDLIPEIEKRFVTTVHDKYNVNKEKAEEIVKPFIQVILDASSYGFSLNHSQPYSIIGYVCGWLREYYPLEFLTSALNVYGDNMDKVSKITEYANNRHVKINPIKFRHSKGKYFFDKDTNTIYKGIASLKYCNNESADALYELRDNEYDDFINLLVDITENTPTNSRQMKVLIKADFFSEFGRNSKLLAVYDQFSKRYKKTHKDNTKIKRIEELKDFENTMENITLPIKEQLEFEKDALGYIQTTYEMPKNYLYIADLDLKYSPRANCYCLNSGKSQVLKISKKVFNKNKIKKGDIIFFKKLQSKPKTRYEDGKYIPIAGTKEWWLNDYCIKDI